jgi:energy-coupling factor transporter ATP-binding protein EcfA2
MDAGHFKTFPNLYILFVGPSGVGKSSSAGIGMKLLHEANTNANLQLRVYSDSLTAAAVVDCMSKSTVTMEVNGVIHVKTPVMIYASEIGTLMNQRNSIRELTLLLTELFNKDVDYESITKGGGPVTIRNPNLTFFACCFPEWINEELCSISLRSGFLGRILTFASNKKRNKGKPFKLTKVDEQLRENLIYDLGIIGNLSFAASPTRGSGEMIWGLEAEKAFDEWTDTLPLDLTSDETIEIQGFTSRKAQYVQRMAMLSSLSRGNTLEVNLEDFKFGLELMRMCERNAKGLKIKPDHAEKTEKLKGVILRLKGKKKDSIIPIRDIMPYVFRQMTTEEVNTAINVLCGIGFCRLVGRKVEVLDENAGNID